jgi:hypothetical protein
MVKVSLLFGIVMCYSNAFAKALPMTSQIPERILYCMINEAIGCKLIVEAYSSPQNGKGHRVQIFSLNLKNNNLPFQ